jgi:hypothetical protein
MTDPDLRTTFLALAAIFQLAEASIPSSALATGAPPFCVARGGYDGGILPQICAYFDYQACLQAAAKLRGNCVENIDYRGADQTTPVSAGRRQRRH